MSIVQNRSVVAKAIVTSPAKGNEGDLRRISWLDAESCGLKFFEPGQMLMTGKLTVSDRFTPMLVASL